MAGDMSITVDSREWLDAVRQYAIDSGKDNAEALNRQMNNFAIHCLRHIKAAEVASIRAVESLPWWIKYVAKRIAKTKGARFGRRVYQAHYNVEHGSTAASDSGYVEYAKELSKKIIRSRLVAVRFLKFFFVKLSQQIRTAALGQTISSGKTFSGFDASFTPATPDRPAVSAAIIYTYRRRSDKTARAAEGLLQGAMNAATPAVIRDMQEYGQRQAEKLARRYSGGIR